MANRDLDERTPVRVLVIAHNRPRIEQLPDDDRGRIVIRLAGRTGDVEDLIDSFDPDVALVDTTFPDHEGYSVIERVIVHAPKVPVLALTTSPAPHDQVSLATRAGAAGYLETDADPAEILAAVESVQEGGTWFPSEDLRRILSAAADELDTTSAERRARLSGVVFALVPLAGLIAAMETRLWRSYMGRIGVRPVDLAVDPASRVIDVLSTLLYFVGIFGPLLLVGSWLDMLEESQWNRGVLARILRHRGRAHLMVSVVWLAIAAVMATGPDLALTVVVGPIITLSIMASAVGARDELPRGLRIEGVNAAAAVAGSIAFVLLFVGLLAWEVLVVGPDLRTDGEHGFIATKVLGVNAIPVQAYDLDSGGVSEVLYLGGNADLYVLVDVCDDNRVDYVSVGRHRLVIIESITCPADASG